jgi:hypothetical protein
MPDSEDRAHVFETEFTLFIDYWSAVDERDLEMDVELWRHAFAGKILNKLLHLSSGLSFSDLNDAIALVWVELKRHKIFKKLAPFLKLYAFLKRVQQSERDYHANKKIEKQKRIEQQEKEHAEREKERQKSRLRDRGLITPSPDPEDQDDASDASDASDLMPRAKRAKETPLKDPVVEYLSD